MIKGCIFNIERFAVHDGPGIRDLIFMKGCPLRCKWCSNPESQNAYPEILFNKSKCIGYRECGMCVNSCPVNAIQLNEAYKEKIIIDRTLCNNCGECASICPSKAINLVGKFRTIREIIDEVNVDIPFFRRSNGGITVSGGEPLFQPGFVSGLLKSFQDIGIYTTIETSGYGNWENMESVCKYADLILYDIKHMDSSTHKYYTGVNNELILENLKKFSDSYPQIPIIVRTPVIPFVNSSEIDIKKIYNFINNIKSVQRYELLPYHNFGESKYYQLGRDYFMNSKTRISDEHLERLKKISNDN